MTMSEIVGFNRCSRCGRLSALRPADQACGRYTQGTPGTRALKRCTGTLTPTQPPALLIAAARREVARRQSWMNPPTQDDGVSVSRCDVIGTALEQHGLAGARYGDQWFDFVCGERSTRPSASKAGVEDHGQAAAIRVVVEREVIPRWPMDLRYSFASSAVGVLGTADPGTEAKEAHRAGDLWSRLSLGLRHHHEAADDYAHSYLTWRLGRGSKPRSPDLLSRGETLALGKRVDQFLLPPATQAPLHGGEL